MTSLQLSFILILIGVIITYYNTGALFVCHNNGTVRADGISCACKKPWTGQSCSEYPCVHGLPVGNHYDTKSIFFHKLCLCNAGYTGDLCEMPIFDRCLPNGKQNGELCVCKKSYSGERCEKVDCCIHGQLSGGRCSCHYGWSSNFCDEIQCHQGFADNTNTNCTCYERYRGKHCDLCNDDEVSPYPECQKTFKDKSIISDLANISKKTLIITFAVIGALIVSCCFLALYFCMKKKTRQKNNFRNEPKRKEKEKFLP